jgi:hypothetical protein
MDPGYSILNWYDLSSTRKSLADMCCLPRQSPNTQYTRSHNRESTSHKRCHMPGTCSVKRLSGEDRKFHGMHHNSVSTIAENSNYNSESRCYTGTIQGRNKNCNSACNSGTEYRKGTYQWDTVVRKFPTMLKHNPLYSSMYSIAGRSP